VSEGLIGLEAFPALFGHFGRGFLGRLVDAQRSPFHLGAAARHSPPERQGGIAVEVQLLGHNCSQRVRTGARFTRIIRPFSGVHAQATRSAPEGCRYSAMATFTMAEVAARQMFADILLLIARLRAARAGISSVEMVRQAAIGEVCAGVPESARCSASVPSIGGFERTLLATSTNCRCSRR
jgi:hypothetical protein